MADPQLPGGWLPPQAPSGPPRDQPRAPQQPQPRPPVFVKPEAEEGTNGLAVAAIVSASLSIALNVMFLGLSFFFSLLLGIGGWVCAARATRDVRPRQRRTGLILSMTAVGLSIAAAIIWVALIAAGFGPEDLERSLEDLQRNLEQELERQRRES